MKNLFLRLLLAILTIQTVSAQIRIPVNFELTLPDSLVGKAYLRNYVQQALKDLAVKPTPEPPVVVVPGCEQGPEIRRIFDIKRTGLSFQFHGAGVRKLLVEIYSEGGVRMHYDTVVPSSSVVSFSHPGLPFGTYALRVSGVNCTGTDIKPYVLDNPGTGVVVPVPDTPNPVPSNPGKLAGRHFYMNATGNGFDLDDPDGISANWKHSADILLNMSWNGERFKAIDGIRINMKWAYYEPTDNIFRDDILEKALQWCVKRDIRLSICLVPWRHEGDGMFSDGDKARHINGEVWTDLPGLPTTVKNYIPSMQSDGFHRKLERVAKHIASVMARYPDNSDYIGMATAQTEEFQLVRRENPMMITGFAPVDIAKWARFSNGLPMPNESEVGSEEQLNHFSETPRGKLFHLFQVSGLQRSQVALTRGARAGGVRACGFYAGIGAPSGVFDFSTKLNTIFSAGTPDQPDVIYSSEGGGETLVWKDMATDLNLGTFPGASVAIEFDWNDVSANRSTPEVGFNPNALWIHASSHYRRGGEIEHLAMAYPDYILHEMTETLYRIHKDFFQTSNGMTGIENGGSFVFPITRLSGLQGFRDEWYKRGGSTDKQVKIKLE